MIGDKCMKLRVFVLIACIIIVAITVSACKKEQTEAPNTDSVSEDVELSENEEVTSDVTEDTTPSKNQAQADRENEETTEEYLGYKDSVADKDIPHLPFD